MTGTTWFATIFPLGDAAPTALVVLKRRPQAGEAFKGRLAQHLPFWSYCSCGRVTASGTGAHHRAASRAEKPTHRAQFLRQD